MPIEDRDLKAGTRLVARYKGQEHELEVVQADSGLLYQLTADGREFKSPSAAGRAVMGGMACNGWRFWSLKGELKPKREPKAKDARPATKKPAQAKAAKQAKAKKPAAAHSARSSDAYGCGGCGATFGSQKAAVAHAMTHTS